MADAIVRPAVRSHAPGIASCVCEAYLHYIERTGRQPAPMLEDYSAVIAESIVHVVALGERIVGSIVLKETQDGLYLDNVAVRPSAKGTGVGRLLLTFAETEARRRGHGSICLATHELMVENRALYERIGYVEYDHRVVNGYPRVFFRKILR